jgi:hypothetical protein
MATDDTKSAPLSELGGTGLRHHNGYIDEEIVKDLQWPRCNKVYAEMEHDALISGALYAIKQFIKSSEWRVEEYQGVNKPADAAEKAEFIRSCLDDLAKPWSETLDEILSYLTYGFSVHEIVYKKRLGPEKTNKKYRSKYNDGLLGWRRLPIRSQDTITDFRFDDHGELTHIRQQDFWNKVDAWIPDDRYLLFRTTSYKDNPRGLSILRSAYRAYYFRKNIEIQEAVGVERDLSGIPIIRVPSEILSPEADESQKKLRRMYEVMGQQLKRNDQSYILMASDIYGNEDTGSGQYIYNVELLSSSGSRQVQTGPVIERYDRRIMQSMISDHMLLGGQSVGSYSLASSKVDAFKTSLVSYLDNIAAQFNEKAIPELFRLNNWDATKTPKLVHDGVDDTNLELIGKFLKDASSAGFITPDEGIENTLRDWSGFEKVKQDGEGSVMERARQTQKITEESVPNTPGEIAVDSTER